MTFSVPWMLLDQFYWKRTPEVVKGRLRLCLLFSNMFCRCNHNVVFSAQHNSPLEGVWTISIYLGYMGYLTVLSWQHAAINNCMSEQYWYCPYLVFNSPFFLSQWNSQQEKLCSVRKRLVLSYPTNTSSTIHTKPFDLTLTLTRNYLICIFSLICW